MDDATKKPESAGTSGKASDPAHTAAMIRAALPYLNPDICGPLDLFAKTMDFFAALKSLRIRPPIRAFHIKEPSDLVTDADSLITSLRQVARPSERSMIDMIAALLNFRKVYEMYQTMAPLFAAMSESFSSEAIPPGSDPTGFPSYEANPAEPILAKQSDSGSVPSETAPSELAPCAPSHLPPVFHLLASMLPPEQQQTVSLLQQFLAPSTEPQDSPPNSGLPPAPNISAPGVSKPEAPIPLSAPLPTYEAKRGHSPDFPTGSDLITPAYYTPDTLPFSVPSDAEACENRSDSDQQIA